MNNTPVMFAYNNIHNKKVGDTVFLVYGRNAFFSYCKIEIINEGKIGLIPVPYNEGEKASPIEYDSLYRILTIEDAVETTSIIKGLNKEELVHDEDEGRRYIDTDPYVFIFQLDMPLKDCKEGSVITVKIEEGTFYFDVDKFYNPMFLECSIYGFYELPIHLLAVNEVKLHKGELPF